MNSYPPDLPLELDGSTRVLAHGAALLGGEPTRLLRLTHAGATVIERLRSSGAGPGAAAQRLARLLVDAGLAHPRPPKVERAGVTVVVPVRDRAAQLGACLAATGGPAIVVDDGSRDPEAIAAVCQKHGARVIRREVSGGPAVARNAGLALVHTPLVAFVDSDCIPEAQWFERLAGHFSDPAVAAVAPRLRPVSNTNGPVARFAVARSPIDLGGRPARVVPMGRVSYVPSAALLVRRSVLHGGFDEQLRFGEDVDLVWRLHKLGLTVRFDPSVSVYHQEPQSWMQLLARHCRYGTSAAELSQRHPGQLSPLLLEPWSASLAAATLAGRPRLAAMIAAASVARLGPRLRRVGVPRWRCTLWSVLGAWKLALATGHMLAMFAPGILLAGTRRRRSRSAALFLLVAAPTVDWIHRRPALDPVRWVAFCLADDAAYGLGVWIGCLRSHTLGPVLPTWAPRRRGASAR